MNYSLDALWWKLTDSAVRDLASLLTAPALWHSSKELPVQDLLGNRGFRLLLALDQHPQPLHQYLSVHAPFGKRLGLYAEKLLAFWFDHAPHTELLAHNLPVPAADRQTVGAADFIVLLNGTPYHIELACKYYGSPDHSTDGLCGLNRQDRLRDKAAKLHRQMMLLQSADGLRALKQHDLPARIQTASIIRGMAFFTDGITAFEPPLNPYAWRGLYLPDWQQYRFAAQPHARYCVLDRMAYLSPARIPESETLSAEAVQQIDSGLVAVLAQRPDGYWHEIQRLMKTETDASSHQTPSPIF
ncbi:DUF1853 family protein [Neisseria animalis]|uniref:DUF1853 family protein n=1 Tax=Neisseria animalis TaxID=492 RepID=A0A5P3MRK2_NEIAN|nr:DUF1853 family protein [Neisseria animalis]QEY23411.1 DUF1853 family protein [Neisseria animalis]ROW33257.1 DUF1853 family protein [Neisseria animalis]VEE08872.1 Domain of uncharacterised function (DUF1853) [Neisseria animalis]